MTPDAYIPFCGTPPAPAELMGRWLLEPALLAGLALALALGLVVARDRRGLAAGWALTALLFVSPLCALSMALFSARVAQHLLLTLVAAPLLAAALPRLRVSPILPALGFAALFWVWHAPGPYAATLTSDLTYWAMHLSLLGTAIALWSALLASLAAAPFTAFLTLAGTAAQMTLYSALIVLSPAVWHPFHMATAPLWGLSALQDQALGGALMWVGGGLLLVAAVTLLVTRRFLGGTEGADPALPLAQGRTTPRARPRTQERPS